MKKPTKREQKRTAARRAQARRANRVEGPSADELKRRQENVVRALTRGALGLLDAYAGTNTQGGFDAATEQWQCLTPKPRISRASAWEVCGLLKGHNGPHKSTTGAEWITGELPKTAIDPPNVVQLRKNDKGEYE